MLAKALSAATYGVDAYMVEVEVNLENAMPAFITVGLPDSAVKESRERVASAIKNSGFVFPNKRVTVNLAPADIRKEGSAFDLPIAVGILAASDQVVADALETYVFAGELALNGHVRPARGILPMVFEARKRGFKGIFVPDANKTEAAIVHGIDIYPVFSLDETVSIMNDLDGYVPFKLEKHPLNGELPPIPDDFSDVKGQEDVKRAIEIAAAGGHNIIMIGPPGSGKTMLARRIPGIMPPMTLDEALECTKIHSVAGTLPESDGMLKIRPFRSPHHTISDVALVGGGHQPKPGEISLAHNGVLFLDELPEFARNALEVMRQPIEDGKVTISRSMVSVDYPARFMLVASMNPCPCGYYTDPAHDCSCTMTQIQRYMAKISGPLLDRIDIHVEVPAVGYRELSNRQKGEPSVNIRDRVIAARQIQLSRYADLSMYCNAQMNSKAIRTWCKLDISGQELLKTAMERLGLSARAYDRILKVGRTIADLDHSEAIQPGHIAEAIQYRSLDRNVLLQV